jgi:Asp-tRNA(Asn)/Glu-tRNA(Gln) amidotransferase A subunit family amidase
VAWEFFFEGPDADVQRAVEEAIQQLKALGVAVSEVSWPSVRHALRLYAILPAEGAAAHEPGPSEISTPTGGLRVSLRRCT